MASFNTANVVGAAYSSVSGILTVTTDSSINITNIKEDGVQLVGLAFSCNSVPAGLTTTIFPEDPNKIWNVNQVLSPTSFEVNVGISSIHHEYDDGGTASVSHDAVNISRASNAWHIILIMHHLHIEYIYSFGLI